MNKLPNITEPKQLRQIIIKQIGAMQYDNRLRELILSNVEKMERTVREELEKLLHEMSMNQNG